MVACLFVGVSPTECLCPKFCCHSHNTFFSCGSVPQMDMCYKSKRIQTRFHLACQLMEVKPLLGEEKLLRNCVVVRCVDITDCVSVVYTVAVSKMCPAFLDVFSPRGKCLILKLLIFLCACVSVKCPMKLQNVFQVKTQFV